MAQVLIPFANVFSTIPSILMGLAGNSSSNVFSLGTLLQQGLERFAQMAATNLGELLKSGGTLSMNLLAAISSLAPILNQTLSSGTGVAGAVGDTIREIIGDALNITTSVGGRVLTGVTSAATGAAQVGGAAAQGAAQTAAAAAKGAIGAAGDAASQAAKSITDIGKAVTNSFLGILGG